MKKLFYIPLQFMSIFIFVFLLLASVFSAIMVFWSTCAYLVERLIFWLKDEEDEDDE